MSSKFQVLKQQIRMPRVVNTFATHSKMKIIVLIFYTPILLKSIVHI